MFALGVQKLKELLLLPENVESNTHAQGRNTVTKYNTYFLNIRSQFSPNYSYWYSLMMNTEEGVDIKVDD